MITNLPKNPKHDIEKILSRSAFCVITEISGKWDEKYVFYVRDGVQCVREYILPPNPQSSMQQKNRGNFASAVKHWKRLKAFEKKIWNREAKILKRNGYHLFISVYMLYSGRSVHEPRRFVRKIGLHNGVPRGGCAQGPGVRSKD